ncbi:hypothetical protein [Candidatus Phytoplasma phoenicium]|uniref:Uncharacterized protein n=1 Tax=Candidatus Phytoplasma phoenicium TaxID=198422 RepID=A0A0L0MK67_9MOLU|nr:hypothetical protein [Candidatus Phytoplasma phoenicium]KND62646.1 hypothetical protein AlmWB_01600 [Candidatus Phytoplasma phoenicium]
MENFDKNVQNEINLTNEKIQDFQNQLVLLEKQLESKLINSSEYFIKKVKKGQIVYLTEINEFEKRQFEFIISRIKNEIKNYLKYDVQDYLYLIKFDMSQKLIDNSKNRIKNDLLDIEKYLNELKNEINDIKPKFKTNSKNFLKIKTYVY